MEDIDAEVWDRSDYSRRPRPGVPGTMESGCALEPGGGGRNPALDRPFAALSLASRVAFHL